jgi:hypothetical protein
MTEPLAAITDLGTAGQLSGWNPHQQHIVNQILGDCQWLIQHQAVETYTETRPYFMPPRWPRPTKTWGNDCTGTIKGVVCNWDGVHPFDGSPIGYGNTQTFANSTHVYTVPSLLHAQPLDICLYKTHAGPFHGGPDEHATMLTHKAGDGWHAFSMGGDNGPSDVIATYRPVVKIIRFRIPLQ